MELIKFEFSEIEIERVTPWWKFWSKTFWKLVKDFNCYIETDKFIHEIWVKSGFEFDKRSGPWFLEFIYPKWGVKRVRGRKCPEGEGLDVDKYRGMIVWHDAVYHNVAERPTESEVAELFDELSENAGMGDTVSDWGEYFTYKFGDWGGTDERTVMNRKLITTSFQEK